MEKVNKLRNTLNFKTLASEFGAKVVKRLGKALTALPPFDKV